MSQRVLVTGAAVGIGRGVVETFVEHGASVVMADIDEDALHTAAKEIGQSAVPVRCDVTVASDLERAVHLARERWGGLDVLVNNAGIDYVAPFLEHEDAEFDRVMAVNLRGVFLATKIAAPVIADSGGGAIVNIASIAGMAGAVPLHAAYSASKAGVISLTKTAAIEMRSLGIRVNAICPGMIKTPLVDSEGPKMEAVTGMPFGELVAQIQGRMGLPADISNLVRFLASPEADLISGTVIPVDGAITAKAF